MTTKHLPTLCPKFEQAFIMIGKKWNGMIIHSLFEEPLRFCQLRDSINGISDRVLTERLRELNELGVLEKIEQENAGNQVIAYTLTDKGHELEPTLKLLHSWADDWVEPSPVRN